MAALMASQMLPPSTAWPLATAAVSAGSLFSGWLAAAWYGRRGLVYGIAEGGLFALCLLILQLTKGIVPDPLQASRLGLVVFLGCAGGALRDAAGTAPSSQGKFTLNESKRERIGEVLTAVPVGRKTMWVNQQPSNIPPAEQTLPIPESLPETLPQGQVNKKENTV